jgi:hypothetical protein
MISGQTVSPRVRSRPTPLVMAVVVASLAALGVLGCRVTLRFDEPEAGADAPTADRPCSSDQQCSSPSPRCNRSTGRCVACLTNADCAANQFCDPDEWKCRP